MSKKLKKYYGFIGLIGLSIVTVFSVILPVKDVFADSSYTLTFTIKDGTSHTLENAGGHLKIDGQFVELQVSGGTVGAVECTSVGDVVTSCTIEVSNKPAGTLNYNSDSFSLYANGNVVTHDTEFGTNTNILVDNYASNNGNVEPFDHTAWFVWNCSGNLCKKKLENLPSPTNDENNYLVYSTKYIKSSDIDENLKVADLTNEDYYFINNSKIDNISSLTTWQQLKNYINGIGDYDELKAFAYDPCGAKDGKSSISTNGDRNFRTTIYDDSYYGITNASKPADLTYFPAFWDSAFFNPSIDVSNTSLTNPAVIETYLLEPKIVLTNDDISNPITNIEVASDVPSGVATIEKNGNKFTIEFKSNYYDNVVFKITSGTKTYYVMLARITVKPNRDNVEVFVPDADTNSYNVVANYYFSDGSEYTTVLNQTGSGNGGINMTSKIYSLSATAASKIDLRPSSTNPPIGVSYTVIKAGSSKTSYNGTLSGSFKGTYFRIDRGNFEVDYTK